MKLKCQHCNSENIKQEASRTLMSAIVGREYIDRFFKCEDCGKSYSTAEHYKRHLTEPLKREQRIKKLFKGEIK